MATKKINEITFLKMLALLSVLFFHCYRPFFGSGTYWKVVIDSNLDYMSWLLHFNKLFDVHCLFFCSGFLYFMTMSSGSPTVKEQLIKRVKRIVIPYFWVGMCYFVPLYTLFSVPSGLHLANDSLWDGYEKFLTMQFSEHMWFLQIMLVITVICLLLNFMAKRFFWLLLAGAFLMTFVFSVYLKGVFFMSLQSLSDNLFIFVLGGAMYRVYGSLAGKRNLILAAVSLAVFLAAYNTEVPKGWLSVMLSQVAAGSACISALCFARIFADRIMGFLGKFRAVQYFDKNFMDFYMYHMPIPLICAMYLYEPFISVISSNLAYLFFSWTLTLALTAVAVRTDGLIKRGRDAVLLKFKKPAFVPESTER